MIAALRVEGAVVVYVCVCRVRAARCRDLLLSAEARQFGLFVSHRGLQLEQIALPYGKREAVSVGSHTMARDLHPVLSGARGHVLHLGFQVGHAASRFLPHPQEQCQTTREVIKNSWHVMPPPPLASPHCAWCTRAVTSTARTAALITPSWLLSLASLPSASTDRPLGFGSRKLCEGGAELRCGCETTGVSVPHEVCELSNSHFLTCGPVGVAAA